MLSEKALGDFKQIIKEETGKQISDEVAIEEASALLTLMNLVYRPIKKQWLENKIH